jgi:hypothetical protein
MFPPTTNRQPKRSLRELMRGAVGTALEFATLGEATIASPQPRPAPPAPGREHPHRRSLERAPRTRRRAGMTPARAQVCTTPVPKPPAYAR